MLAHAGSLFFPPDSTWLWLVGPMGSLGMTLFFVLSGFVIHYNYATTVVGDLRGGAARFFQARFARIYPLFILLLLVDLATHLSAPSVDPTTNTAASLPFFLTLTQSWIYLPLVGRPLHETGFAVGGLMWSISTEWFFYLCYPILALAIVRLRRPRAATIGALAFVAAVLSVWFVVSLRTGSINAFASDHYGDFGDGRVNGGGDLLRWLFYFSPYTRIAEFVLGCMTAQVFVTVSSAAPNPMPPPVVRWLMPLLVGGMIGLEFIVLNPGADSWFLLLSYGFGVAPLIAALIYCCARYPGAWTARALSLPLLVACGDASYSIYLLHPMVFEFVGIPAGDRAGATLAFSITRALLAISWVVLLSISMYRCFEAPARAWLRRGFAAADLRRRLVAWSAMAAPAVAAVVLFAINLSAAPPNTIGFVSATYAAGKSGTFNNAVGDLALQCLHKASCTYVLDTNRVLDPAPGEAKVFTAQWRCRGWHPVQSVTVSAPTAPIVRLTCR